MEMITRLRYAQQPVDGLQPLVCLAVLIVDTERRRVRDQDIQGAPILYAVQPKPWKHSKSPGVCLTLAVLIRPIGAIADASAVAADQKLFMAHQFQVQVGAALYIGQMILRVIVRVMVSGNIHQRNVQKCKQVLKVRVRQIAASED